MVRTKPHNPRLQRGHSLARNLKGFFPFSEHGGDSSQDLALGNTATPLQTNPPSWLATEYGSAIKPAFGAAFGCNPFQDPGSDEIEAFTVSIIARNPHVPGNTRDSLLFGFDQNYLLVWDSINPGFEGKWIIYNGATYTTVSLGTLAANTWYHFVCMHTAGDTRVYVDGVLVSSTASITGANNDAATKIEIGDRLAGNWEFEGDIVHCGFWDRMLSSSEVADHYIDPFAVIRPRKRVLGKSPAVAPDPAFDPGIISKPAVLAQAQSKRPASKTWIPGFAPSILFDPATVSKPSVARAAPTLRPAGRSWVPVFSTPTVPFNPAFAHKMRVKPAAPVSRPAGRAWLPGFTVTPLPVPLNPALILKSLVTPAKTFKRPSTPIWLPGFPVSPTVPDTSWNVFESDIIHPNPVLTAIEASGDAEHPNPVSVFEVDQDIEHPVLVIPVDPVPPDAPLGDYTKIGDYTAVPGDRFIMVDATLGPVTITLFTAVGNPGNVLDIKKIDSSANPVTVAPDGSETIDEGLTRILALQYDSLTILPDNIEWWIL